MLTASQQDYIEVIYRLEALQSQVRISDIAAELGTRLPTVTRMVRKLALQGLVNHVERRSVGLSAEGRRVASEVVHRHEDLVRLFTEYLGLSERAAQIDVCQIEHGLSPETAQRLHEFLVYLDELGPEHKTIFARFQERTTTGRKDFRHLPAGKTTGWRS